jgi:hypothetical protein
MLFCCFFGKSWILTMYLIVTFTNKTFKLLAPRFPCRLLLFASSPLHLVLPTICPCDPGSNNPRIAKATSRGDSSQMYGRDLARYSELPGSSSFYLGQARPLADPVKLSPSILSIHMSCAALSRCVTWSTFCEDVRSFA